MLPTCPLDVQGLTEDSEKRHLFAHMSIEIQFCPILSCTGLSKVGAKAFCASCIHITAWGYLGHNEEKVVIRQDSREEQLKIPNSRSNEASLSVPGENEHVASRS